MTHLIAKEVAQRALEAHAEQRLTAQNPNPRLRRCMYQFAGHVCAIGASYQPPHRGDEGRPVYILHQLGRFTTDNLAALVSLQAAHDNWCGVPDREAEFLATARRIAGQ